MPAPTVFGDCAACPHAHAGAPALCFRCAERSLAPPHGRTCDVCGRELDGGGRCANPLCRWPARQFERARAIWPCSGELRRAIHRYKEQGHRGWARVFARLLVGHLDADPGALAGCALIVASPAWCGPGGRGWDHIDLILRMASGEARGRLSFAHGVVVKLGPTRPLHRCRSWAERLAVAREQIRPALSVPEPARVRGRRVLVFDDVLTAGLTLDEVARALRAAGAGGVCGLTLARQPAAGLSCRPWP